MKANSLLRGAMAVLRTRILAAVVMPALIGGACSLRLGVFHLLDFALILVGLACVELLNLFGSDLMAFRHSQSPGKQEEPLLPGNPVISPELLQPRKIPFVMIIPGLIGTAVLVYFLVNLGPQVLHFLVSAALIGLLYVYNPFPFAFLSTSLIPPIISGGVFFTLSGGEVDLYAFLAGLPISWISLAVILSYRAPRNRAPTATDGGKRNLAVFFFYSLAGLNIIFYALAKIFPPLVLTASAVPIAGLFLIPRIFKREKADFIPATAVGVIVHFLTSLLIAVALIPWAPAL